MRKNPAAVALGRLGGKARSKAKALAVRKNGKLGGRPKIETHCPDCGLVGGVAEMRRHRC